MRNRLWRIVLLLIAALLVGCGSAAASAPDPEAEQKSTIYVFCMDTVMELSAYGAQRDEALQAAQAEIERLNALFSIGEEESDISRVNRDGGGPVSADTAALLREALALSEETGGVFDPTIYPLMALWGFVSKDYHVPTGAELADALSRVGASRVTIDGNDFVTLGAGQAIDLGGIAKGYASQRLMAIFREYGVRSAIVSLGGNIQCLGLKPNGQPWRIGVKDPADPDASLSAIVSVEDEAVITSGGYERYFDDPATGRRYQHIIDPATGYPVESGLSSVSIVTANGTLADGLSTALYIMGLDGASDYWRAHSGEFEAILIDGEGTVYITEGLSGRVTSEKELRVIQK